MAHIHIAPGQHDHTVSFFIVRTDFPEPKIMLHVHRKTEKLSMFGGHVELYEDPWETLLHELVEESGYAPEQVKLLQPHQRLAALTGMTIHPQPVVVHTGLFPVEPEHYHTDMMYALVTDQEPSGEPLEGESTDIRLFTLEELREIPAEEINEAWREIGIYILEQIYTSWDPIPMDAVILKKASNKNPMHLPRKSDRSGFSSATHCVVDDERWPCTFVREASAVAVERIIQHPLRYP